MRLNFEKEFGETEKIILPINYRSSKNIVEASNHFIQISKKMHKKNISCSRENEFNKHKIFQLNANNDFGAARYILYKIQNMKKED